MRRALSSSVALLATLLPLQASAADVSEAGAREIVEKLTYYLPKDVVDTGFLKVTAGTNRYELSVDFAPLLKDVDKKTFSITGLKPFVQYLTPQDDGLWTLESNDRLNVSGQMEAGGQKSSFTYIVDKIESSALFDPVLTFTRSAEIKFENLKATTQTGPAKVEASLQSYSGNTTTSNINGGVVDLLSVMSGTALSETISDPSTGDVTISVASMDGRAQADKIGIVALRDLVVFGLDKWKSKVDKLTPEDSAKLKALIKANVPLVDNLVENITFHDVQVKAQGLEGGFDTLGYKVDFNGIKADTRAGFEVHIENPKVPMGILPPGTEAAVPQTASMGVAITGLNVEGIVSYLADNADFTKSEPLTPAQSAELGKIVIPGGWMNVEFTNVAAKSAVYDLSLAGTMQVNPDNSDKPRADITITAKDLDKTVQYLQDNSKTVPEFGQASFMVLMMKGFGQAQPDGSMTWNVKLDETGKVLVNGREMPQ